MKNLNLLLIAFLPMLFAMPQKRDDKDEYHDVSRKLSNLFTKFTRIYENQWKSAIY